MQRNEVPRPAAAGGRYLSDAWRQRTVSPSCPRSPGSASSRSPDVGRPGIIRPLRNPEKEGQLLATGWFAHGGQRKGGWLTTASQSPGVTPGHQPIMGQADAGAAATATLASTVAAATATCIARRQSSGRTCGLEARTSLKGSPPARTTSRYERGAADRRRRCMPAPGLFDGQEPGTGWRHPRRNASNPIWPVPTTRETGRARGPARREVRRRQRPPTPDNPRGGADQLVAPCPLRAVLGPPWLHASLGWPGREGTNRDNRGERGA